MLIECSECSNEVSDKATSCPKCGHPVPVPQESSENVLSETAVLAESGHTKLETCSTLGYVFQIVGTVELCGGLIGGIIVGQEDKAFYGVVVAVSGVISGLSFLAVGEVLSKLYESTMRLKIIESLIRESKGDIEPTSGSK